MEKCWGDSLYGFYSAENYMSLIPPSFELLPENQVNMWRGENTHFSLGMWVREQLMYTLVTFCHSTKPAEEETRIFLRTSHKENY